MDLSRLFILEFIMFAEMAAGYLLCRFHVLKSSERSVLSRLVINLLLPCSIISSFSMEMNAEVLKRFLEILLISIGVQVMQTLIASIAFRSVPHEKRASLQYATVCSNAGFLGNAVAEGVYGAEGLLYTQIYLIPQRVVMWSAGVSYFADGGSVTAFMADTAVWGEDLTRVPGFAETVTAHIAAINKGEELL